MQLSFTAMNVLAGSTLLGGLGGALGSFALLRRQSLLGDALAHAALPGVCLAYLLTGSKAPFALLLGALATGLLGSLAILGIVRFSRVKEDAAMGIVLSVFFGLGIVLLTVIQKLPAGNQSGLDKFLFGQAATLVREDLITMAVLATAACLAIVLLFKEMKLLCFDPGFAASLGLPVRRLEILLTLLLVVVVVVGLQTVGVVLIVATLITPAAAARQWTDRLSSMVWLAAAIGALSGAFGSLASSQIDRLPTGPVIVLASSLALILSLVAAPGRGLVWQLLRERRAAARIRRENLLKDLYRQGEERGTWDEYLPRPLLMGLRGQSAAQLARSARPLVRAGWVERSGDALRLTGAGRREASQVVRNHRLWELYLKRRLELPADHVHRDAEAMEHVLSPDLTDEIDRLLDFPRIDPHGREIPARAKGAA